jgi:hypothetical protein
MPFFIKYFLTILFIGCIFVPNFIRSFFLYFDILSLVQTIIIIGIQSIFNFVNWSMLASGGAIHNPPPTRKILLFKFPKIINTKPYFS